MSREALLIQTLVELADNLVDDFDVIDVLSMLGDRCLEALGVESAGVMLAAPTGELQVVASSSDAMRVLELFELQADEGPCVDCYRDTTPIVNVDLAGATERWPRFAQRAIEAGFHSVHALPMRLRGHTIGALNMFGKQRGALEEGDVVVAQALADVATITIIQHQTTVDAQVLNAQLNQALNSRIIIEQAKGKLSESANVDMESAFQRLRNHARNHNLRLTDLCQDIADGNRSTGSLDSLPTSKAPRSITSNPRQPPRTAR
jgi:GAF domain-containing protein